MNETATMNTTRPVRGWKLLAAGMVLAVSASVALSAWAAEPGGGHGPRSGHGGMGLFMGGPMGGHGLERMLDQVSATEAQRTQIKQIVQQAATELKAQRETTRSLRERGMQIFTAPAVDPAAAESVRQQMLVQHDNATRRTLQAMLDVSRVLTPEQRAKLGELMKQRQQRMQERMQRHEAPKQ